MRIPLLVAVSLVVAGCVAGPADQSSTAPTEQAPLFSPVVPAEPDFDFTTVVDPDHGAHQLPDLHAAGHGLKLTGHAGLQEILPPGVRGSITQVDVWSHYAAVSGMEGGLGFAIVDLADLAAPKAVGWFPSAADGWTARFSDDGDYVFYGCQMFGAPYTPATEVRGSCEDPDAVHTPNDPNPAGIAVVDTKDKAAPKLVSFLPAAGSHNIQAATINGTDYVFTSAVQVLRLDRATGLLEKVAEVPGVHDATVSRHPVTGQWLLYTGTGELSIWNVDDPTDPVQIYDGTGNEGWTGWHEQTVVPGLVDGRVILLLAGESFLGTGEADIDIVSVVDITDPAKPVALGTWKPPFAPKAPWVSYLYSAHEMAATPTGQVAVGWYHGGAWVFDISTKERQASPVTLAAYQPNRLPDVIPSTFAQTPVPVVPMVWGTGWMADGHLLVPDMHTGLYVLEPEWGLHPAIDGGQ